MPNIRKNEPSPQLQLAGFLAKFTPEIAVQAEEILIRLRATVPHALELVYDNYNALAIGFGPTERASDAIVSIAIYPRWVSLFFLQAKGLPDPHNILKGQGNVARHIVLAAPSVLDGPAVQALIREALTRAKTPIHPATTRRVIIKSISAKQRPRRPTEKPAKTSGKPRSRNPKPAHPPDRAQ
jgi:hypothetical protein